MGVATARMRRFKNLPVGSEQWVRYRVLYTVTSGAEVRSEWCTEASYAVARTGIRAVGLSSLEAFAVDAVLHGDVDGVVSLPVAGFEVQCAASRAAVAAAAIHRVPAPPAGQATVNHK